MRALSAAFRETLKLFGSQRKLWVPFLVTAFVEVCFIGLVWLAPQEPFSKVLAPPVRYFFGDRVLHYPWHLWFLYHAMKHTNVLASFIAGAFMSGLACAMVQQVHNGAPLSLREALMSKQVRFGRVVLLWGLTWGSAKGLVELVGRVVATPPLAVMWYRIGLSIALQLLLIYVIPAAVFDGLSWWRALGRGIRETCRYPISTLFAVGVPTCFVLAYSVAFPATQLVHWIRHAPELVLVFVAARLILWTIADGLMTVSIAHLWWAHRTLTHVSKPVKIPAVLKQPEEDPVVA